MPRVESGIHYLANLPIWLSLNIRICFHLLLLPLDIQRTYQFCAFFFCVEEISCLMEYLRNNQDAISLLQNIRVQYAKYIPAVE